MTEIKSKVYCGQELGVKEGWEVEITMMNKKTFGVMVLFVSLFVVMLSQMYTYVNIYWIVHFKYVTFIVCQFYPNEAVIIFFNKL